MIIVRILLSGRNSGHRCSDSVIINIDIKQDDLLNKNLGKDSE